MLTATESNFKRSDFQSHLSLCDSDAQSRATHGEPELQQTRVQWWAHRLYKLAFSTAIWALTIVLPELESSLSPDIKRLQSCHWDKISFRTSRFDPPVTPAGGIESGPHTAYHHVSDLYIYVLDLNSCNWPTSILPPSSFLSISQEGKR